MNIEKQLEYSRKLLAPFADSDVKWRVQTAGGHATNRPFVMVIPYISNRAIQKRLDDVFGVFGWENSFIPTNDGNGFLCGLTIKAEGFGSVTKWDGAEKTNIEALKGGLSDSMKRAAVQLGIGRYLYQLDAVFAECSMVNSGFNNGYDNTHTYSPDKSNRSVKQRIGWNTPLLPEWAQPIDDTAAFIDKINAAHDMESLRIAFKSAYRAAEANANDEFMNSAIHSKTIKKQQLLDAANEINEGKFEAMKKELQSKMISFKDLPTKATVDAFKGTILENLKSKLKSQPFDGEPLVKLLEAAAEKRNEQIKLK